MARSGCSNPAADTGGLVIRALKRARTPILTVAITSMTGVVIGILMVHSGNGWAIAYRDRIVSTAQSSSITTAFRHDDRLRAAALDFSGNLYVTIASTLGGLGVLVPYPIIVYRSWIGGIVSIDSSHASRFDEPNEAVYYLVTLTLQLIPYVLASGAGVNMGLAYFRPRSFYQGDTWFGIPREAIRDMLRIYLVVIPLLFIASLWEFIAR